MLCLSREIILLKHKPQRKFFCGDASGYSVLSSLVATVADGALLCVATVAGGAELLATVAGGAELCIATVAGGADL